MIDFNNIDIEEHKCFLVGDILKLKGYATYYDNFAFGMRSFDNSVVCISDVKMSKGKCLYKFCGYSTEWYDITNCY